MGNVDTDRCTCRIYVIVFNQLDILRTLKMIVEGSWFGSASTAWL